MTPEEEQIQAAAFEYAKAHRTEIANRIVDTSIYAPDETPIAVFMAGSPGAGKTEVSKEIARGLEESPPDDFPAKPVLRIDPDEFRDLLPGYTGNNSWMFQSAVTKILERVLDRVFQKRVSFILDGTLANYAVAERNIDRALRNDYAAQIIYVYQEPGQAWTFVMAREAAEGRNIPLESFAQQFVDARNTITRLKTRFCEQIALDMIVKNMNDADEQIEFDVSTDQIDAVLPAAYDQQSIIELVNGGTNEIRDR